MKAALLTLFTLLLLAPAGSQAQGSQSKEKQAERGKAAEKATPPPKQYLPPPGMCRIWVDNVPAARQPAPTDCPTAIRNRPPNARVIFPPGRDDRQKNLAPQPTRGRPDTVKRKPPA